MTTVLLVYNIYVYISIHTCTDIYIYIYVLGTFESKCYEVI